MRRLGWCCALSVVACVAWASLGALAFSPSERVYLLVPLVHLALSARLAPERFAEVRRDLRRWAPAGALAFALVVWNAVAVTAPPLLRFASQAAVAFYFLIAVLLVCRTLAVGFRHVATGAGRIVPLPSGVARAVSVVVPAVALVVLTPPYFLALSHVHRPKFPLMRSPADLHRAYENVTFANASGQTLRGWFVPAAAPSDTTVVFCHGLNGNREQMLGFLCVADQWCANALFFDFQGHGESGGYTVTMGRRESRDVIAAVDWLRRERPASARRLFGVGFSMGSACQALAGAEIDPPLDGYVIEAGYACSGDLVDRVLGMTPDATRPWLKTIGLPLADLHAGCSVTAIRPERTIGSLRAPVLLFHSKNDALIPLEQGERLFAAAREPKALHRVEGPGHYPTLFVDREFYLSAVRTFFAKP